MKKKILTFLIFLATVIGAFGGITAFADVDIEECDKCFRDTVNGILEREDVEGNTLKATRSPVYDVNLEHLGFIYDFDTARGSGYAIIICDRGEYVAIEMLPQATSPYADLNAEEQYVFANVMSYFKATDGKLCHIDSGELVTEQAFALLEQNAILYQGGGSTAPEKVNIVVEFKSIYSEDDYEMSGRFPQFCGSGITSGCAAVAGGNLIGYFDRYYEDLIPNHSAGKLEDDDLFYYGVANTYVYRAIEVLYEDMGGTENGISESSFKSGLEKYCSRKGLRISYSSVKSSGKLDYAMVKSSMKSNKPVVLFLSTYNICDAYFSDDKDYLDYLVFSGNHVMVGFGYRDIIYNMPDGSRPNNRFIHVATGFGDPDEAYFNIDFRTNVVSAYGVNIY